MALLPTFANLDTLKSIREDALNPTINKVNSLDSQYTNLETKTDKSLKQVALDAASKKIKFVQQDGTAVDVDLSPIIIDGTFPGITVMNETGQSFPKIKTIQFSDGSDVRNPSGSDVAVIGYDWDALIPKHQEYLTYIDKDGAKTALKEIKFTGEGEQSIVDKGSLTVNIPKPIPFEFTAQVPGQQPTSITKIHLIGNNTGGHIVGDELQITIPDPIPPIPATTGFFEGFYASYDDMVAAVKNPVDDRSYAFALKHIKGKDYYLPYMYVNKTWKPVQKEPEITYTESPSGTSIAVTSVKPVAGLVVNPNTGELDLSGLVAPPPLLQNFQGIFNTENDVQGSIPNPVEDKTFAIVRNASNHGFLPYAFRKSNEAGDTASWKLTPMLGHLMHIDGSTSIQDYKSIYGIRCVGSTVDKDGIVTLPRASTKGTVRVAVTGTSSTPSSTLEVRSIRFPLGAADVVLSTSGGTNIATIQPAQRVLDKYTEEWGAAHQTDDYLGKIYYDKSTGKWMGMTKKSVVFPEPFWTPIAHKGMSEEVSDQTYRYPRKIPKVITTQSNIDSDRWMYSGTTYVEAGDEAMPPDMKVKGKGAFIKTDVKDDPSFPTGKETRLQTCTIDDGTGLTYMRAWDKDSDKWKPWIRTSYSIDDFKKHEIDPSAHRSSHRFYRVSAMDFEYAKIHSDDILTRTEVFTILDSYGHLSKPEGPGTFPYPGKYRVSGRFHFQGYRESSTNLPAGTWTVTLIKQYAGGTAQVLIGVWEYRHTSTREQAFKSFNFSQENVEFDLDDNLLVKFQWKGDEGALTTAAPKLRVMGTRSYLVVEDMNTSAGTLSANAFLQIVGRTLDRGAVATHTHRSNADETGSVRTYATPLDTAYSNMTRKTF